jgi:hypothetical protein
MRCADRFSLHLAAFRAGSALRMTTPATDEDRVVSVSSPCRLNGLVDAPRNG